METTSIYKKLFEAKKEIGKISKDSENPFFKSKYFDINKLLEHVEPILAKHGLLLLQPIKDNNVYSIIVDVECATNITEGSDCVISFLALPNVTDPQKLGSAITYYRRYTLQSLLGLQAEDDDANAVSGANHKANDEPDKAWLNVGSKEWEGALSKKSSLDNLRKYFKISKANAEQYELALNK